MNNEPLYFKNISRRNQYYIVIITVLAVAAICYLFSGLMGYRVTALILLLTVSLLAVSFDILPVLIAAALSALVWDVFFIPPKFTFHVDNTEDGILLIMYFIIAMINAVLTYKLKSMEKLARLKEEKANSVKLYNTILNSLSHELRTPIATITAATDNLQTNIYLDEADKHELVTEISKASLRLNQQVENLLNISRLESGHAKPKYDWCDIQELIYSVVNSVEEHHAGKSINISLKNTLPLCLTDKGMLEQILYNLLSNAARHTAPATNVYISANCFADVLEIIVEDEGESFNEQQVKQLLQKFSTEQNSQHSIHGLGLSIVKGFTDALGGNIEVSKSYLGGGKFTISLPVSTTFNEAYHE